MELKVTLAAVIAAALLAVLFGWLGARPPDPTRGPRLMPWRWLMVLSAATVMLMLVHLVNLLGVTTGR